VKNLHSKIEIFISFFAFSMYQNGAAKLISFFDFQKTFKKDFLAFESA